MSQKASVIQSLKLCALNLETAFWDKRLGIKTLGVQWRAVPTGNATGDFRWYESKCYSTVRACLRPVRMGAEDVFYDVGCGAGRVLCVVAQGRIRKCVGVELTPQLCHLARENARNLRGGHTAIEIVEGDATRADYSDGTVFFFYNPFGAETLEEVLRRIRESVLLRPRRIQCIYLNPTARHVFENQGWLKLTARRSLGTGKTLAHYYSSVE